jgi:hypothetical protein
MENQGEVWGFGPSSTTSNYAAGACVADGGGWGGCWVLTDPAWTSPHLSE